MVVRPRRPRRFLARATARSTPGYWQADQPAEQSTDLLEQLAAGEQLEPEERARLLGRLSHALNASVSQAARAGQFAAMSGSRLLAERVMDLAPRIPVRDLETLQRQFPGLEGDALADALTGAAVRNVGLIGMAAGSLATVQLASPPLLLTIPAQVAAETLAVIAVELKLVAELHEVYGRAAVGTLGERSSAYIRSWAHRRGLGPLDVMATGRIPASLGVAARYDLRRRVRGRLVTSTFSFGPLMVGAALGATVNRRQVSRLGRSIRNDLRRAHA